MITKSLPSALPEFAISIAYGDATERAVCARMVSRGPEANFVSLPKTKNGKTRHIPEWSAVGAVKMLQKGSLTGDGAVFVNIEGKALHGYEHWFDPAVEEAGLRDFIWYCLRHTFASRLAMAGMDLRTISELMGHKTIQ